MSYSVISTLISATIVSKALVLSGGGSPSSNHHSQYLQTKRLTEGLVGVLGWAAVEVRFGAGNDLFSKRAFADVHATLALGGGPPVNRMEFGVIDGNAPATKQEVVSYFQTLGTDDAKSNFFLFVSDHGYFQSTEPAFSDNCIDLWSYDPDTMRRGSESDRCLSKVELETLLKQHVRGLTVFQMSQCYSGGFHQMSVSTADGYPAANPRICGFTATTEDETSSGCTPDVDGPGYKGYERYFTQQLTGRDVVTSKKMPYQRKKTMKSAHFSAALEDKTKDIPLSTSDYYLRAWAEAIESKGFMPRTTVLTATDVSKRYSDLMEGGLRRSAARPSGRLEGIIREKALYGEQMFRLLESEPSMAPVADPNGPASKVRAEFDATLKQIADADVKIDELEESIGKRRFEVVFPPWHRAVSSGLVAALSRQEVFDFEHARFAEVERANVGAPGIQEWIDSTCILRLAEVTTAGDGSAETLAKYCAAREEKLATFASRSLDPDVKATSEHLMGETRQLEGLLEGVSALEMRRDQLRRMLIAKKIVAAAVLLEDMQDEKAIQDTLNLAACESTRF